MTLVKRSPCKVNLLLNILGRRADGFHEVETVMHPIRIYDELTFSRSVEGIEVTCSEPGLPTDARNLVHRASSLFLQTAKIKAGVRLHLEKRIPLAAGLGGGRGKTPPPRLGLTERVCDPLSPPPLTPLATSS